ncbi:hypothetical protein F4804DRAFT_304966 [Jackrogersella minutella]|nr:hypothetical protein F4804DRAFT_304966 [Jackrogersella minutella]
MVRVYTHRRDLPDPRLALLITAVLTHTHAHARTPTPAKATTAVTDLSSRTDFSCAVTGPPKKTCPSNHRLAAQRGEGGRTGGETVCSGSHFPSSLSLVPNQSAAIPRVLPCRVTLLHHTHTPCTEGNRSSDVRWPRGQRCYGWDGYVCVYGCT